MCRRRDGIAAVTAAAAELERACTSRFPCDLLRSPATVKHLPTTAHTPSIVELLQELHHVMDPRKTKH